MPKIHLTLLEATDRVLGVFDRKLSAFAQQMLSQRGANVLCNAIVTRITGDAIEFRVKMPSGAYSQETMQHGLCVWAGGIARRPIVEDLSRAIGGKLQTSRFGLVVDDRLRVKGIADGSVFSIGDCAVSGCAPTAQAAYQQGKYLGRMFRDGGMLPGDRAARGSATSSSSSTSSAAPAAPAKKGWWGAAATTPPAPAPIPAADYYPPFWYDHKGALAYTGGGKGVAELKSLWDNYPSDDGTVRVEGTGAFAIWRSLYFSKLMSARNMSQVLFDWSKVAAFGRDISSPFMQLGSTKEGEKKK